jgi:membrane fusion protein, copper/silver efflux system
MIGSVIARRLLSLAIVLGLAVVGLAGCQGQSTRAATPEPPAFVPQLIHQQGGGPEELQIEADRLPELKVQQVQEVSLPGSLETSGLITFDDRSVSTIVSRVQGRIEQNRVSVWDNVLRGEKIVALYSPDFMTAEAEYLEARETTAMSKQAGSAPSEFTAAILIAARRKLELLGMSEADINAITRPDPTVWMRAPISGTVVENKALRGGAVNPGDELFSLGTITNVWVTGDIYEDDLARVRAGQDLTAVTTAYPNDTFSGAVARISPNIDPNTHTAQIRCEIHNPDGKLKPQMLATVRIITPAGSALIVPQEALVFDTDAYFAFVETSPGEFERRKVLTAPWSRAGFVRVTGGLKVGERVVTGETLQVNSYWHQAHGISS